MTQLLQNAAYGTALILAAAVLRRVLKDRLIPGARLALWAVCLFRLLTPAAPESVLSLWGFFRSRQAPTAPAPAAGTPQVYIPAQTAPSPAAPAIPWEAVLLAAWLVVGGLLAARYVLGWRRTRRAVACAIPVDGRDPRYASLPKCARLREGPMEGAPLTFGVVRPTVVLSPGLEGEALDCVLAHEGVHASRRDNLWHYVMATALVIHWWNPAVWLMARLLRRDIELSCDRAAVKKLGADRRAEYANTLVSLATQGDGPAFCQTFGRKAAEERILSVMKFKKTSVIGVVLSLALVLAVTVAFASAPKEPDAPDTLVVDGVTLTGDAAKYASQLHAGMTKDEVHQLLGEPHSMFSGFYGDIYILNKLGEPLTEPSFDDPAFLIYYDYGDFNGGVSTVYHVIYRVGREHVDLIQSDQPTYVNPDENAYDNYDDVKAGGDGAVDPSLKEALEAVWHDRLEAAIKDALDEIKAVNDYDVKLPTFDEDGDPVSGIVGEQFYSYGSVSDPAAAAGSEPVPVPSAGPEPVVPVNAAPARGFDDYTIVGMDENGYPVDEQGNSLVFDDNGNLFMKVRSGYGPCIKTDCTVSGEHHHANGEVIYHYGTLPAQAAEPVSTGHHGESHHGNGHH